MGKRTQRRWDRRKAASNAAAKRDEIDFNAAQAQADIPHTPFAVSKQTRKRIKGKTLKWSW